MRPLLLVIGWLLGLGGPPHIAIKTLYLGYNHTEALQQYFPAISAFQTIGGDPSISPLPFNPKEKVAATLAYSVEGKWRMGVEASFSGNQYIYGNKRVPDFWFFAAMIERKFKLGSVVLNCENLLDSRQSRTENIVEGTPVSPVFKPIWGPVEGRVLNLSLKLNL